jgi:Putative virion core protein (lumpy skin disease virus)
MIIWLASYPKSGNTWLRSLLASYYFSDDGTFDFDLLKKIDAYPSVAYFKKYKDNFSDPDSTSRYWISEQENINKDNKVRFFKTHNAMVKINGNSFTNENNTLAAIHIVRDPRNVITSIANHFLISQEEAFDFLITENKGLIQKVNNRYLGFNALCSWKLHEKSWSECNKFPVLTIKYEDFQKEVLKTFEKVINFISNVTKSKNSFNLDKAKKSVESCNFEKLSKLENEKGFDEAVMNQANNKKIKFFNLGIKNNFQNLLKKELICKAKCFF